MRRQGWGHLLSPSVGEDPGAEAPVSHSGAPPTKTRSSLRAEAVSDCPALLGVTVVPGSSEAHAH